MNLLPDKRKRAVWLRAFHIWQKTPHRVAPLSDEKQICQSCGTEYVGNFCPRCGQSARIGRFSFKTAFLLFLDIWGVGNRGMFRTIRDLMLRPGYMIRDYVNGKQSAYFPPFKMFFILTTFSLLLSHPFNISLEEPKDTSNKTENNELKMSELESEKEDSVVNEPEKIEINGKKIDSKTIHFLRNVPNYISKFNEKSPSLFSLMMLILISVPLYLFFRRSPFIPDLRYSEHLVALVYTSNMYTLYRLVTDLIPIPFMSDIGELFAFIMLFLSLKQFTGYSKRRLLWYFFLTSIICVLAFIIVLFLGAVIVYFVAN